MSVGRLPQESAEYAALRDELQAAEIALRDQRERVAELRRQLPRDTAVEDVLLREVREGAVATVRLSELFSSPDRPLILMHFMFGGRLTDPCPMCTGWADGYDGILPHLQRRADFAICVAGDPLRFSEYARGRGWRHARIVSTGESSLKRVLGFETEGGDQLPGLSVFEQGADGSLRHFYSQSAFLGAAGFRGMDLLNPLWHFLDATPEGRGDFMPSKRYGAEP